jgi:hypothetical protein
MGLRPRITWVIVGAVAGLLVVAGLDAIRSSGNETAVPTATGSTTRDEEASRSLEQELEQTGNNWARVFAAGRRCNRFMSQPACEQLVCHRTGGPSIPNCAPVSSKVQRSFSGAVVEDIVIRGQWAAARFSNRQTIRFHEVGPMGRGYWWIERVGAGRALFE